MKVPHRWLSLLLVLSFLLFSFTSVSAQGALPISVNQNVQGVLTPAAPAAIYSLSVTQPQTATIQVLALEPGMVPIFSVVSPSGVALVNVPSNGTPSAQAQLGLSDIGAYTITIQTASSVGGEFILSIIGGAPLAPPQPIQFGQIINAQVDAQTPLLSYAFSADGQEATTLQVVAADGFSSGPVVTLKDASTSETLAVSGGQLGGMTLKMLPGLRTYIVVITHSGATLQDAFRLCVGGFDGVTAVACPPLGAPGSVAGPVAQAPTAAPNATAFVPVSIPQTGPCSVASGSGSTVNVRSAPNTNSPIVTRLAPNVIAPVLGRLPDASWYQVNISGVLGWISGSVIVIGGQCGGVLVLTPTAGPTAVVTSLPTFTPTPTATPLPGPGAAPTLNPSLPAVFGTTALTSGFVPDPFTVGITAGGPAGTSYLGAGCTGFTTASPSYSVTYTSGAFPTLRFYFIGSGDTTMIINTPSGNYVCVDDSFGTLNPTIDFNTPSSGRYDVWIGTFSVGGSVGGTLYVTESTGNRP
jgi:uncharacterized protein YraI